MRLPGCDPNFALRLPVCDQFRDIEDRSRLRDELVAGLGDNGLSDAVEAFRKAIGSAGGMGIDDVLYYRIGTDLYAFAGWQQRGGDRQEDSNGEESTGHVFRFEDITRDRLRLASEIATVSDVPGKPKAIRRSGCPVSISLEMLGDHWSLLIIRDMMVRGFRTFKEFRSAGEGIATNILSDRLQKLEAAGIVLTEVDEADGRRVIYRLTDKGIDLAPVMLEFLIWGARHEETVAPPAVMEYMEKNRRSILAEVRRRWRKRDSTPLLPWFEGGGKTPAKSAKNQMRSKG